MSLLSAHFIHDNSTLAFVGAAVPPTVPDLLLPAGPRAEALSKVQAAGQLQGTAAEQVVELAGRTCYDSMGAGRSTPAYHQHIIDVNHGSVWEHVNFTVAGAIPVLWLSLLLNRPGVFVRLTDHDASAGTVHVRITLNLRSLREWAAFSAGYDLPSSVASVLLGQLIHAAVDGLAPLILGKAPNAMALPFGGVPPEVLVSFTQVMPAHEEEQWVTLLLTGSRGFSHELVRHGDRTAISQRSTRYVDETDSPWVDHPLVTTYRKETGEPLVRLEVGDTERVGRNIPELMGREVYAPMVNKLQAWLIARGVDKVTARKQARGAARGYLGNALYTEVVFSASVAQWKRILRQRLHPAADAEIREVASCALDALRVSAYADAFDGWSRIPSPDGIGVVLA